MKNALFVLLVIIHHITVAQTIKRYDLIINEIMADPSPQIGLPNTEYVEIKNISGSPLELKGISIADANSSAAIKDNYILDVDSLLVLTSTNGSLALEGFAKTIALTGFPTLDNDGDLIMIVAPDGRIIHAVQYSSKWYRNELKSNGGWSIELIDSNFPWSGEPNWKASTNASGGTPGQTNSVNGKNEDNQSPRLISAFARDSIHITLAFDEAIDSSHASNPLNFSIPHSGTIQSSLGIPPLFNKVELTLATPLQRGKIYEVTAEEVSDCAGNIIGGFKSSRVGLSEIPDSGDIIINEILFHPKSGGVDYLELINRGTRIINLQEIVIANRSSNGNINTPIKVSEDPELFFPGDFLLVTENLKIVEDQYLVKDPAACLELTRIPTFPNDEGYAIVLNFQGIILDELHYNKNWHFALISNDEGISLERIDAEKPTQDKYNWHSASMDAGFGTPSYKNSQSRSVEIMKGAIVVSPEVFSPDNDGYNDYVTINYQFDEPGMVCNITVFDIEGRRVRYIARNALCGTRGYFTWDGLDDRYARLGTGVYIILTELYDLQGRIKKFKRAIVLAKKF